MENFKAPFVLKINFSDPTQKSHSKKNPNYARYIATRPGVAIEDDKKLMESADLEIDPSSDEGHAKYLHERPGSHGLFSQDPATPPNLIEVEHELAKHQGVVWRMIASLREEDAMRLSMMDRQSWEEKLRNIIPEAADKMNIDQKNLRWVAAFHEEKDHPHVHIMIWEKEPDRSKGVLSTGEFKDVKRAFTRHIYEEERVRLYYERSASRDLIRDLTKETLNKSSDYLKEIDYELKAIGEFDVGIAPRADNDTLNYISKELYRIAQEMPGRGRASLQYMPEQVKVDSRKLADYLLEDPIFRDKAERYYNATASLTKHYTFNEGSINKAIDNAKGDLRDRIAQEIVKGAAKINQDLSNYQYKNGNVKLGNTNKVAANVFKHAWRGLEKDRIMNEAKVKLRDQRLEKEQQLQKIKMSQSRKQELMNRFEEREDLQL